MSEDTQNKKNEVEPPYQKWWYPPFDATTNFSLLGWLLDKLTFKNTSEKKVDFKLENKEE